MENFLYQNDTIFISAQSGVGKSVLALQLLASLTSGKPFLEAFPIDKPKKVLYLQTEGDRAETLERIKCMEKAVAFNHENWVHINLPGVCLNTPEGYKTFMELAAQPKMMYDVIIIDPLYTTVKGSLNNDDVATDWIRYMRSVRNIYDCAFVVIHHDSIKEHWQDGQKVTKSDKDLMGSSYWGAFVTYNYKLTVNKEGLYTLSSGKERNKLAIDRLNLRMIEPDPLLYVIADDNYTINEKAVKVALMLMAMTITEIIAETKLSRATAYRILRKLGDKGLISKTGEGNRVTYKLINPDPLSQ